MKLTIKQFRVLNYRNINDSGWIPLERVTAFVGRNESGKTALLKALHKFNPATAEPYNAQRDFPRDRFTAEYRDGSSEWPVCEVEFELSNEFQQELRERLNGAEIPQKAILTRFYDGSLKFKYDPEVPPDLVEPDELKEALNVFAKGARRLASQDYEEQEMRDLRTYMANWADEKKDAIAGFQDLRTDEGSGLLRQVRDETNSFSHPTTADLIEALNEKVDCLISQAEKPSIPEQLDKAVESELPIFIYFENYGILDSAVYLPRFLEDLNSEPQNSRIRTINAMFKHANLTAAEIANLGQGEAEQTRLAGQEPTEDMIQRDQEHKELRSIKLNSASNYISDSFNKWYGQRRHTIKYDADGDYFRIWVSDDLRPDVDIELESRSKGFQWFFSFYLVFLVESEEGHKDAVLLLDEPGLHLHPTAQQELLSFFENLSKNNPLIYTTHSPFLIDGEHIHRVRPVTEDKTGHSCISIDGWPKDRETIFPLQAAAGYAMVRGLFQHQKNVLVEGMTDYLYLHSLNLHCHARGRKGLPDDIYITPCGGTKYVGHIASLFLGQEVRPVVLLDGDSAGRGRRDSLMRELYAGNEKAVLMLGDVLDQEECEIEDIIGEETILAELSKFVGKTVSLNQEDRNQGSLVDQIKRVADRDKVGLPEGWKPEIARRIVVSWSTAKPTEIPEDILDRAEMLFKELTRRFEDIDRSVN